jgi:micrococcal nuclease
MAMKKVSLYFFLFLYAITLFIRQGYAEEWFYVRWVNDGDTIVLKDGRRVRYIGINSPEVSHDGRKTDPYADSAKNYNKRLVFAKQVRLEFDKEKKDHYGRLLAYVYLKGGG